MVLEIEDTGPGLPADVRDQLFTPFFSTKDGGQGIGLTLVHEILANHQLPFALDGPPGGPTRFTHRVRETGLSPPRSRRRGAVPQRLQRPIQ